MTQQSILHLVVTWEDFTINLVTCVLAVDTEQVHVLM